MLGACGSPAGAVAPAGVDLADCARCHAEVAGEWETSLHRHAFDDAVFAAAYALEPRRSCAGCHAPRDASRGVDCETCHLREGRIAGARRRAGSPHGPADPSMATVDACAACHQFDFPDEVDLGLAPSDAPMQSTLSEWAASPAGADGTTCQDCHMGEGAHLDHRFAVRDDLARLRDAIEVTVSHDGSALEVELHARGVGHAYPTGDLFRRLELTARAGDRVETRVFGRTFAPEVLSPEARRRSGFHALRRDLADDRLFPGEPRRVRVELPPDAEVTLDYLLMPPDLAASLGLTDAQNRRPLHD